MEPIPETIFRRKGLYLRHSSAVTAEDICAALEKQGRVLKESSKAVTRRVDGWVIKANAPNVREHVKIALRPNHYRALWQVPRYLMARGVNVPQPVAYAEYARWGIPFDYAYVSEFIEGAVNVEEHARRLDKDGAEGECQTFLQRIADSVRGLSECAFHGDLSGKNLLTRDGGAIWFIDMDAVRVGVTPNRQQMLLNHIQLYDSFCDLWDDTLLQPFIAELWAGQSPPAGWFDQVKMGQANRRARSVAIWEQQGKQPRAPGP